MRHKWYVFLACMRFKVNLWQAISHDWTKFTPSEWFPYVHTFYKKDGSNQYKVMIMEESYREADALIANQDELFECK